MYWQYIIIILTHFYLYHWIFVILTEIPGHNEQCTRELKLRVFEKAKSDKNLSKTGEKNSYSLIIYAPLASKWRKDNDLANARARLEGGGSDELEHYLLERISDYWIDERELVEKWYKSGEESLLWN